MRILLVEDDPSTAQAITTMLRKETWIIDSTDLGEDGLDLGKIYDYDLIILDLMLPEINGVEFLRQMRAKSLFDDVPVMVLSALIDSEHIREALDAGADRYLTKPYIASNLTTIVLDMLRTGRRVHNP